MRNRPLGQAILAVAVALLSACSAPPTRPIFVLTQAETGLPEGARALPGEMANAAAMGSVTVDLTGLRFARARALLATLADVDHFVVGLTDASHASQSKTVAKDATSCTFDSVSAGQATISVDAIDATGKHIGTAVQAVTVTAGQGTTVQLSVALDPHLVPATPTPTPPPAGGGTGTPTAGQVGVSFDVTDGPDALPMRIVGSVPDLRVYGNTDKAVVDKDHHLWAVFHLGIGQPAPPNDGELQCFDGNGTLLATRPASAMPQGSGTAMLATDALGGLWADGARFDAAGTRTSNFAIPAGRTVYHSAADPTGNLWLVHSDATSTNPRPPAKLIKLSPAGQKLFERDLTVDASAVVADPQGRVYVQEAGNGLLLLGADGSEIRHIPAGGLFQGVGGPLMIGRGMAVDSQGVLWVMNLNPPAGYNGPTVVRIAPDGAQLGVIQLSQSGGRIRFDARDHAWIQDFGGKVLHEFAADGTSVALHYTATGATEPSCPDGTGGVWVYEGGLRHYVP
jgi:streptogramin lyase